jgi:hypothetical protein
VSRGTNFVESLARLDSFGACTLAIVPDGDMRTSLFCLAAVTACTHVDQRHETLCFKSSVATATRSGWKAETQAGSTV